MYTLHDLKTLLDLEQPADVKLEAVKMMVEYMRDNQPAYYLKDGYMGLKKTITEKSFQKQPASIKRFYVPIKLD